jgi:hypothetical protein
VGCAEEESRNIPHGKSAYRLKITKRPSFLGFVPILVDKMAQLLQYAGESRHNLVPFGGTMDTRGSRYVIYKIIQ